MEGLEDKRLEKAPKILRGRTPVHEIVDGLCTSLSPSIFICVDESILALIAWLGSPFYFAVAAFDRYIVF